MNGDFTRGLDVIGGGGVVVDCAGLEPVLEEEVFFAFLCVCLGEKGVWLERRKRGGREGGVWPRVGCHSWQEHRSRLCLV